MVRQTKKCKSKLPTIPLTRKRKRRRRLKCYCSKCKGQYEWEDRTVNAHFAKDSMKIADTHDEVNMTETMPYVDMKTNNARKTKLLTEVPVQIANTYAEISDVTDQKIIANCEAEDEVLFRVPIPRWQHTSKSHFKEQLYSNNPDGSVNSDDSTNPDGSVNSDGSSDSDDSTNPDGYSDSTNPDGSSDPTNPDGSVNSDDSSDSTNPDDYKYPEGPENVDFTSPNLLDNDNNEVPNV